MSVLCHAADMLGSYVGYSGDFDDLGHFTGVRVVDGHGGVLDAAYGLGCTLVLD